MADEITKIDAARRQLLAALYVHWFLNEPLAVYTLATNAGEICDTLLTSTDRLRTFQEIARTQGIPSKSLRDAINTPRNFLKHADRDPDGSMMDIPAAECDAVLLSASIDYMVLCRRSPMICGLYPMWYSAVYPEKCGDFFRREADALFPQLVQMPRAEQIRSGKDQLDKQIKGAAFPHFKNEMTDHWRWETLRRALNV